MNDVFTWPVGRGGREKPEVKGPPVSPIAAYVIATTLAGTAAGSVLGLFGYALRSLSVTYGVAVLSVLTLVISLFAVLIQWNGDSRMIPQRTKQVPRRWLLWRSRSATAFAFGLLIGFGAATPLRFAAMYILASVAVLAPSPILGAAVGAIYGFMRGAALIVTWISDRFLHRRLPWESLTGARGLNRALAVVTAIAYVVVFADIAYPVIG